MGFEPRMRGRRFGRPAAKKSSAKIKRESEATVFYEESAPVDPAEVRSATLNSLEHLGKQRFALPPFSEHFQRWTKDVRTVLNEFDAALPTALDPQWKARIENTLGILQATLNDLTAVENKTSDEMAEIQRQLSVRENDLSRVEREYRGTTSQLRKRSEQSFEKLRREIDSLDRERSRLLHAKPTLLQRLLRKPDTKLEKKTTALNSRKTDLSERKESLKQELERQRIDHERRRATLVHEIDTLRQRATETKGRTLHDAVEARGKACDDLSQIVRDAVDRLLNERDAPSIKGTDQAV